MNEHDEYEGCDATARSLFGRVVAGSTPIIGFSGDSLVEAGRSRQRRTRVATLIGGAASVTAVAVAVPLALGGGAGDRARTTPGTGAEARPTAGTATLTTSGTPTAPTTPAKPTTPTPAKPTTPTASKTTSPDTWLVPSGANGPMPAADLQRASASFHHMVRALDPTGKHLSISEASLDGGYGSSKDSGGNLADVSVSATFWPDGNPRQLIDPGDPTPFVDVQLDLTAPTALDQIGSWGRIVFNGTAVHWQHRDSKRLPDGTTVKWAWTTTPVGTEMAAQHILQDGRQVVITVNDGSGDPTFGSQNPAKPSNPFPFTTQQLVAMVSDPALTPPMFK